jgi:hypothetical protein
MHHSSVLCFLGRAMLSNGRIVVSTVGVVRVVPLLAIALDAMLRNRKTWKCSGGEREKK